MFDFLTALLLVLFVDWPDVERAVLSLNAFGPRPRTPMGEKVGRNDPCPCGSGKKYKKCHYLQGR